MARSGERAIEQLVDVTLHAKSVNPAESVLEKWRSDILESLKDISEELLRHSKTLGSLSKTPSKTALLKIVGFLDKLDDALHQLARWLRHQKYLPLKNMHKEVSTIREAYWDEEASGPISAYCLWVRSAPIEETTRLKQLIEDEASEKLRRRAARKIEELSDALYDLVHNA